MTMRPIERTAVPLETGVWFIVLGELCVFTLFFATFLYYRSLSPELFEASRATLQQGLGAANTIILLTSSWLLASAVQTLNADGKRRQVLTYLAAAILCGIAFVVVKIFEYAATIGDGVNVLTDDFYMFYFMLTGIHLMHLLVGLALLSATILHLRRVLNTDSAFSNELVGFASCFWHMIDIVWIVLFPLLYLLQ